jgi:hypothetical protein
VVTRLPPVKFARTTRKSSTLPFRTFSIPFCSTMTLTESPHLPDTCSIRAFRRMPMPSSASRLRRASHTSGLGHQPPVAIDHRHLAAESSRRLGHLHSDVAPADNSKCPGISSSSRASICVSGCASARPGIIFSARVPVLTITFAPRS